MYTHMQTASYHPALLPHTHIRAQFSLVRAEWTYTYKDRAGRKIAIVYEVLCVKQWGVGGGGYVNIRKVFESHLDNLD